MEITEIPDFRHEASKPTTVAEKTTRVLPKYAFSVFSVIFVASCLKSGISLPSPSHCQLTLYETLPPGISTFSGPFSTNAIADVPGGR